ncbi:iron-containing redox enzyme family protein [Streptomyces sp. PTM05]|uniref:Iron-containing redox enzyme family protein n=1 Tax=Streptantibioticus parmotrematis TaxID=2873249 RepID=A0ABS7QK30_9ACTN|nr:iron-containing redox enzyme family protein [Streptantibioticus parmotrematis]MBY8883538.1 iron-containing redox enzyme family protein [Streptantibioticus parmotrematis]
MTAIPVRAGPRPPVRPGAPAQPAHHAPPPRPRGELSEAALGALTGADPGEPLRLPSAREAAAVDPLGEDSQLTLYVLYELHYRGFPGVPASWEWHPDLLRLRGDLERGFEDALRERTAGGIDLAAELDALLVEPVHPQDPSVSHHLADTGVWWQLREYLAHRSVYHLKEADPHAWVIPRLTGQAKASLVAVEFDEFGGGRGERVHARLFADLLAAADLDDRYGGHLDAAPAVTLATVNLMSLTGLHRSLRGALVGHFAAAEITTAPSARRMVRALEHSGHGEPGFTRFYTEHIEADAVHEQVMRHEVIGALLAAEPELTADVVFGIQATGLLEERLAAHLVDAWTAGRVSLRVPLPDGPHAGTDA